MTTTNVEPWSSNGFLPCQQGRKRLGLGWEGEVAAFTKIR